MKRIIKTHGTVSFVWGKGAKVQTQLGEVYVPERLLTDDLVWGARVSLCVTKSDKDGERRSPFEAEEIKSVLPPLPVKPIECYGRVKWFRDRRGYVALIDHPVGGDARLDGKVCPGLKPIEGDYVRVMVVKTMRGLSVVTEPEFGDRITSVAMALEAKPKHEAEPAKRFVATADGAMYATAGLVPKAPARRKHRK
jgi:hypothetical protein